MTGSDARDAAESGGGSGSGRTPDAPVTRERVLALPKAELHVHLDGSIRPETMLELADEAGVALPASDPVELAAAMRADDSDNLVAYLETFATTLRVLQTGEQLERVAYELTIDHAAENVKWVEVRFSPWLNTGGGLSMDEVLDAVLAGLHRAESEVDVRTGVIVCALRHLDPDISMELAELAVAYRDRGVVAVDLAAAEKGNPAALHAEAFRHAAEHDLARTVHAGEAFGPPSIRQALLDCAAHRIGHGTRLQEDESLERYVRDHRIPLEICLTSNVQTRVARTFAEHPVRRYFDQDIPLTLCTDNRLVSGTTVTDEYLLAHEHLGFTMAELQQVARMGFEAAFLPWPEKRELVARLFG